MYDNYEQTEIILVLKYGSMADAYKTWCRMSLDERAKMSNAEYELIMEYEYNNHYPGLGSYHDD